MNLGIILAAGKSSRFGRPKQFYPILGKPMIRHSLEVFRRVVDKVIIITNSKHFIPMLQLHDEVFVNDQDSRLSSIKTALKQATDATNVVIHDAARPFVKEQDILYLFNDCDLSQYYFEIENGLLHRTEPAGFELARREKFIELATPQRISGRLFREAYSNYITPEHCELLPFAESKSFSYQLIEGHRRRLQKITKLADVLGF